MIDTIQHVLHKSLFEILFRKPHSRSSDIHKFILENGNTEVSLVTIKRLLARLVKEGLLSVSGNGPATRYALTATGKLSASLDAKEYSAKDPDTRYGESRFQFDVFPSITADPFSTLELEQLNGATSYYEARSHAVPPTLHSKELERFIIELSWKSSKIEGNTYTLLDTEKLLLYGTEAHGHSKDEALMILNHKSAFSYIYASQEKFKHVSRLLIEEVHTLLTKDLGIARNLRSTAVGVTGSRYQPLDTRYQIEEALIELIAAVERMSNGYAKALVLLIGLSYIQAFEDGNKRTARLMANAVLLAYNLAPLSYRSVSEEEYREATLVFYELNSLAPFKKLFIEQYLFAAHNYLLS